MKRIKILVILCAGWLGVCGQVVPREKPAAPEYDRKEEIIYDGKRYRIHNSYLTLGPGYLQSSIRPKLQEMIGIDFQFPVKRLHFQAGVMMSGESFGSNNNVQGHIGYGWRKEKNKNNLAAFVGPSFYTGVEGDATSLPRFYQGFGLYGCAQAATKFSYDIGIGIELFGEISPKQSILGLKLIAFFSGAYRGAKKNYNPHVRSENP